jgi:hypothetical protein
MISSALLRAYIEGYQVWGCFTDDCSKLLTFPVGTPNPLQEPNISKVAGHTLPPY